ncbi:cell envelope integrity protein CreD [Pelagibius sp.]|uniref:cell envelope integrity protein CreD n=1 Tax=Pelagibius sp. TaxID=1931238 RepID=UPI002622DCF3|nr:cell envelope integrity protein CreD [Pelagibius sp.]
MVPDSIISRQGRIVGLKAALIIGLGLLFLLPLDMVRGVIVERSERAQQVAREIAGKWAHDQSIRGPFLIMPLERRDTDSGSRAMQGRRVVLLPDEFSAEATVDTQRRARGIFESVVYTTQVSLRGAFTTTALARAGFDEESWRPRLDQAVLALGISDLRGLQGDIALTWNEVPDFAAEPGMPGGKLATSGVHWPLKAVTAQGSNSFDLTLTLRGSSRFSFVPVGKDSDLVLRGDWPDPSFDGRTLPIEHEVGDEGFSARWEISHLSRPLPQSWTSEDAAGIDWSRLSVGASFLEPVNFYLLSERSVKYGLLFVALLFLTFFLFELLAGIALHPLQYLMVGAGLVLFFLSLVAFAEVLGFAAAYGLSSALVAAMVSLYAAAILKRRLWAMLLCAMIVSLYALLFLILNLEEAALLGGTLLLFAALGLTMYVTRNVDWSNSLRSMTEGAKKEAP